MCSRVRDSKAHVGLERNLGTWLGGEIGKHAGLKLQWTLCPCGFDSRPDHKLKTESSLSVKRDLATMLS